jgi:molybdopterin/thiamine biosynthesis adenylyltransferase
MVQPRLRLKWSVLESIINTVGYWPAETGGAIGGDENGIEISHFYFDYTSRRTAVTYSPDDKLLNHLFKKEWNPNGIRFRGFVHSHPGKMCRPSSGDAIYAEKILRAIDDLEMICLPIVNTVPDTGAFRLTPWMVYPLDRGVSVIQGKVQVVDAPLESNLEVNGLNVLKEINPGIMHDEIVLGKKRRPLYQVPGDFMICATEEKREENQYQKLVIGKNKIPSPRVPFDDMKNATFERVQKAYDLDLMHQSRIIVVGVGGAASWVEDMARAGLGQFVLIDPDVVSETNLATQQTYRRDIGRPKVDCVAERIRDINPAAKVVAMYKSLDDISDDEIRQLSNEPIEGLYSQRTIICGLTDNFFAQARVNRIALNLGLPSLCAQVYQEGRGAEITFTFPDVTPACHRCVLSSRYRKFLEQGFQNPVTSHGTPIFAASRLNAIKGFVALALLHHGSSHPRWGNMLKRIGNRNLIQIRMDPDFADTTGLQVFNRVFENADKGRLFFDEVVWLPQKQECPDTGYVNCPDCGGSGNLLDSVGKLKNTRI